MDELITYLAVCIVTGMALLSLFRWRFPQWSIRRTALLSAMPVPTLTLLVCAWVATKAALAPAGSCGVDACGMAMAFAFFVAIIAILAFLVTSGIAAAVLVLRRRRRQAGPHG